MTDLNTEHEMFPQSGHSYGRLLVTNLNTEHEMFPRSGHSSNSGD